MTLVLAAVAGALIGLSLGALGGGGSILAVPVLVYVVGEGATEAITGSLVVVGAVAARRGGQVLVARGVVFGALSLGGAYVGARLSLHVSPDVLLGSFALLMLLVGTLMAWRIVGGAGAGAPTPVAAPILTFSPLRLDGSRALKLLVTATAVGALTGFLGVGGGFLIVPALLLALSLSMHQAAGTSLVVITITSLAALVVRLGHGGPQPDWTAVLVLTAVAAAFAVVGARLARGTDTRRLQIAFTVLVLAVAVYTAVRALPALLG